MTEDEIERRVEALFDMLDWRLKSGELTQAEYDRQAAEIAAWADEQYKGAPGGGDHPVTGGQHGRVR
jgi:hypothetical protein